MRVTLLMVAAACVALATITLWKRGGVAYVNLESALQDSRVSYRYLMVPVAMAAVCLVAAALPRIVAINVAVTVGLLAALEMGARLLVPAPPPVHGEPTAEAVSAFSVRDATLGYVMARSVTARHRRQIGDTEIYDVTYRTDARGRRDTPTDGGGARSSFLLFFGDSNVFGEGLSQTETLPYFAGEAAPGFRPYNYGVPGYGPSHVLALAQRGGVRAEVEEAGDFTYGRPLTTLAYFFWASSALAERSGVELPMWYTERDYRLTARVLQESSRLLTEQLRLRGAVVVLAQVYDDVQRGTMDGLRAALARNGASYLDYTRLIDGSDRQYRLAELDYHNSAKANRIIARRLVADLIQAAPPDKRTDRSRGVRAVAKSGART